MLFLIDEDMGPSVGGVLSDLGYEVLLATEVIGPGATDDMVIRYANDQAAVIVTGNKRDYIRVLDRRPEERPRRFRNAGCILLMCQRHTLACARLRLFREFWELEHALVPVTGDPRVLVEITPDKFIVIR